MADKDKKAFKNKLERIYSNNKLPVQPKPPPRKSSIPEIINLDRKISIDTDEVPTKENPILSNNKVDVKQPILSDNNVKANADDNIQSNGNTTIVYVLACFNCFNGKK